MRQTIYDNPTFFDEYEKDRRKLQNTEETIEFPAMRSMLASLENARVIDLGSSVGVMSRWIADQGAESVLGVDISERVVSFARRQNAHSRVEYVVGAVEDLRFDPCVFDVVFSAYTFVMVREHREVMERIFSWLRPGGTLLFSSVHPFCVSRRGNSGWQKDPNGRLSWLVNRYWTEDVRTLDVFQDTVIRYHRRLSTWLNDLLEIGFRIERVAEPEPNPHLVELEPKLAVNLVRPSTLIIKATKPESPRPAPLGPAVVLDDIDRIQDLRIFLDNLGKTHSGGTFFSFSAIHPMALARETSPRFAIEENSRAIHWILSDYSNESARTIRFPGPPDAGPRYHRKASTTIDILVERGFEIVAVREPDPGDPREKGARPARWIIEARLMRRP